MDMVLATRNLGKFEQVRAIFEGSNHQVFLPGDVGITGEAIEDGETLGENAFKKAWYARTHCCSDIAGCWTMADDTGIYIDGLGGKPGIYAARWAGTNATPEETMQYCLEKMRRLRNRSARFETAVVLISPRGKEKFFSAEIRGRMLEEPSTSPRRGFPYAPLFVPEGHGLTLAEMPLDHDISNRGQAFYKARAFLDSFLERHA